MVAGNIMFPCVAEERSGEPLPSAVRSGEPLPSAGCSRLHISRFPVFSPAEMTLVGKIGFSSLSPQLHFTEYWAHKYQLTKYLLMY